MKRLSFILVMIGIAITSKVAFAGLGMTGIAINEAEHKCAYWYDGYDDVKMYLPDGWKFYTLGTEGDLETPFGTCSLYKDGERDTEACCASLNMDYVSDINNPDVFVEYYKPSIFKNIYNNKFLLVGSVLALGSFIYVLFYIKGAIKK